MMWQQSTTIDALAFSSSEDTPLDDFSEEEGPRELPTVSTRESMYTAFLHELSSTVLSEEAFLFSPEEQQVLAQFDALDYHSRYLLVRLVLRSRGKWHRLDDLKLKYTSEIGHDISATIDTLCQTSISSDASNSHISPVKLEPSDDNPDEAGSCPKIDKEPQKYVHFAKDERGASVEDLLDALKWEEIKAIGTRMKVIRPGMNSASLKTKLLSSATKQTTLSFPVLVKVKREGQFMMVPSAPVPPPLPPCPSGDVAKARSESVSGRQVPNQLLRLRGMIIEHGGRFIRVSDEIFILLQRLNLVYFRSTSQPASTLLLPLILAKSRRRIYPKYTAARTTEIFSSRDELLKYEAALQLEAQIEEAEADGGKAEDKAQRVLLLWELVYPRWQKLVEDVKARGEEGLQRRPGLERFEEGYVLTRIMYHGAAALGPLKRYEEEANILRELLDQKRWRTGRRGAWYDRLALIYMNYRKGVDGHLHEAAAVLTEALNDPFTHTIYRPRLERRLTRIEKRLKIPESERHVCDGVLHDPINVTITGTRIYKSKARSQSATSSRGASTTSMQFSFERNSPFAHRDSSIISEAVSESGSTGGGWKPGVHSVWVGRDGAEVNVETLALEYYEQQGYRGFHSEGRVVAHLFVLLFWSVLFAPVPGAFETAYQVAPLDLGHDTFYSTRQTAIEIRMSELRDGHASRILSDVDDRERPRKTCALGVQWDKFSKEDMCDLLECIDGGVLATICRVFCEEYSQRRSGVPDLLIWNQEKKEAKFVEVKGPGDTLMEHQKVWIDVLSRAGMGIEVCHVQEKGYKPKPKKAKAKSKTCPLISPKRRKTIDRDSLHPITTDTSPCTFETHGQTSPSSEADYDAMDTHPEDVIVINDSTQSTRTKPKTRTTRKRPSLSDRENTPPSKKQRCVTPPPEEREIIVISDGSVSPPPRRIAPVTRAKRKQTAS